MRLRTFAGFLLWLAVAGAAAGGEIDSDGRARVIEAVASHLESEYVDADRGATAAVALRERMAAGAFDSTDGAAFAERLSAVLQELTGDGHLNVEHSEEPLPEDQDAADEAYSAQEMERWYGAHLNFGVEKVERLEDNVGLLDLRVFPPVAMGGDTVAAAMQVLAHTDALIIDLRENGGGDGDSARLVASYLFGTRPEPLSGYYDRPLDRLTQSFTQPYVPGDRFGPDKPVYVLISNQTFSAAEGLAYDLQALGRATVIGERSGGGAHSFEYRRIHPHFVLWSVTGRSVNPVTGGNWQGVGVEPDVPVPAADALATARRLLAQRSRNGPSENGGG